MALEPSVSPVLIADADNLVRDLMRRQVEAAGYRVALSASGKDTVERLRAAPFCALVVDLLLPDFDGLTVCQAARTASANVDIPILMVSARDSEADRILSLDHGADDYLKKPFGVRELLARLAAIMRRQPAPVVDTTRTVSSGDLRLDVPGRQLFVRGERTALTKQEFDLVSLLLSRRGVVFSRAAIVANLWQHNPDVSERTVDSIVRRLRRKIERAPDQPALILTSWGVGYKFADA